MHTNRGTYFQNQGTFFLFPEYGWGDLPHIPSHSRLVARLTHYANKKSVSKSYSLIAISFWTPSKSVFHFDLVTVRI